MTVKHRRRCSDCSGPRVSRTIRIEETIVALGYESATMHTIDDVMQKELIRQCVLRCPACAEILIVRDALERAAQGDLN